MIDFPTLMSPERLDQGYVIVLPGIEGRSFFNRCIVRGLHKAGVPYAIEIDDWTVGFAPLLLYNLRALRRNLEQADRLAAKIATYHHEYPGRPLYMIGHSGGAAMIVLALERLPTDVRITGGVLLAAAISPKYAVESALDHTQQGLWNFSSWGDLPTVGIGTTIFGTIDGRHSPAAGLCGFAKRLIEDDRPEDVPQLREVPYRLTMAFDWNLAGHFGCVHPKFIRKWVAPILLEDE